MLAGVQAAPVEALLESLQCHVVLLYADLQGRPQASALDTRPLAGELAELHLSQATGSETSAGPVNLTCLRQGLSHRECAALTAALCRRAEGCAASACTPTHGAAPPAWLRGAEIWHPTVT